MSQLDGSGRESVSVSVSVSVCVCLCLCLSVSQQTGADESGRERTRADGSGRERTGADGHVCACLLISVCVCLSAHVCTCLSQSADGHRRERTGSERGVDWGARGKADGSDSGAHYCVVRLREGSACMRRVLCNQGTYTGTTLVLINSRSKKIGGLLQ